MASIDGVRPGPFRAAAAELPASRHGGFAVPTSAPEGPARSGGGSEAAGVADLAILPAGVLAAQEYGNEPVGERLARRQGMLLLRQLSRLQIALLGEGTEAQARDQLAGLATALEESIATGIDPRLRSVLASLALRARIELARPRP
jgi:hypothetical protein